MSEAILEALRPQWTGGYVVNFREGVSRSEQEEICRHAIGSKVASLSVTSEADPTADDDMDMTLLEDTGIGFISSRLGGEGSAASARLQDVEAVELVRPEFYLFDLQSFTDTAQATWGLQATGAVTSRYDGSGIRVAVLDTGLDMQHPDWLGRSVKHQSFIPEETVDDGNGHGTHCAGTACGGPPIEPGVMRYGVAPRAEVLIGKVLSNGGSGAERQVQRGILWAINSGAQIISMSLGSTVRPGEQPTPEYERLGRLALGQGALIIAAAGNESQRRFGFIAPVGSPANSPSVMAVAAVDENLAVADFSCGGINGNGGAVDIAGPGVGVLSSYPRPRLYRTLSGTSMACPHVAGCAALWAQSNSALRGQALWNALISNASPLAESARDVGAGLVQAP